MGENLLEDLEMPPERGELRVAVVAQSERSGAPLGDEQIVQPRFCKIPA